MLLLEREKDAVKAIVMEDKPGPSQPQTAECPPCELSLWGVSSRDKVEGVAQEDKNLALLFFFGLYRVSNHNSTGCIDSLWGSTHCNRHCDQCSKILLIEHWFGSDSQTCATEEQDPSSQFQWVGHDWSKPSTVVRVLLACDGLTVGILGNGTPFFQQEVKGSQLKPYGKAIPPFFFSPRRDAYE